MTDTSFPYSAICYILADIPGDGEFQATGVIIGPHTILTASHELWDADVGQGADAVSIYPGYQPAGGYQASDPTGALGGTQAIHYLRIADNGGELSPKGTQHDFAIIDTSTNLSSYGHFALNYGFEGGDAFLTGYPATSGGALAGSEAQVAADATYSDLDTQKLAISPGDSGGPIYDYIPNGRGGSVPAVAGIVSTGYYASKIIRKKINVIRNWVDSDSSLWTGQGTPGGIVTPQIADTVDSATLAARLSPSSGDGTAETVASAPVSDFAALVDVLHHTRHAHAEAALSTASADTATALISPEHHRHDAHPWTRSA